MLLICTPVGFGRLFTVTGKLLTKLKSPRPHIEDEESRRGGGYRYFNEKFTYYSCNSASKNVSEYPFEEYDDMSEYLNEDGIDHLIAIFQARRLEMRHAAFKRNCVHPTLMIVLLLLTVVSVLMVTQNTLELCFGFKALPVYSQNLSLGINSLSTFGLLGSAL
ncbi:protein Lilipod [Caerostris extrusa]|uniref:Protein Lilipod n=1 Tax=Caerostris extrusa TaxID=172846 RepID=A0AAV4VS38_CAEEX|nr:protein Lilipod [Caerostris extrusa]